MAPLGAETLVYATATTPFGVWDFVGNQLYPRGASDDAEAVTDWVFRASPSKAIFVTNGTARVWRLIDPDWTPIPLPDGELGNRLFVAGEQVYVLTTSNRVYALSANEESWTLVAEGTVAAIAAMGSTDFRFIDAASRVEVAPDGTLHSYTLGQHAWSRDRGETWESAPVVLEGDAPPITEFERLYFVDDEIWATPQHTEIVVPLRHTRNFSYLMRSNDGGMTFSTLFSTVVDIFTDPESGQFISWEGEPPYTLIGTLGDGTLVLSRQANPTRPFYETSLSIYGARPTALSTDGQSPVAVVGGDGILYSTSPGAFGVLNPDGKVRREFLGPGTSFFGAFYQSSVGRLIDATLVSEANDPLLE